MNRELTRVSALVLVMFLALFTSSSIIQSVQAESLNADQRNSRTIIDSFVVERGAILVDGQPIAQSVPSNDLYNWQREYTNGGLYAAVTGYNTLDQGNTGIEGAMNAELTGTSDSQFLSEIERLLTGRDPQGAAVSTTINAAAQQAAAEGIGDFTGAAVALDPETGEILAMYSSPTFDPNQMAVHDSQLVIDYYNQLEADPAAPLQNRAIGGDLYFPGSVFKMIVASAALKTGDYTLESEFDNPAELKLPQSSSVVKNSTEGQCGPVTDDKVDLETSIVYSCNIPFAQLAAELGEDTIAAEAQAYGFGQPLEIPMGVTPSSYPSDMSEANLMLTGFGQYDVRVTPMQMAMMSASIANDGTLMKPNLIDEIVTDNLTVVSDPQPEVFANPSTPGIASTLRESMEAGVDHGYADLAQIEGATVGGKTGTAENGTDNEPYNLWFTGYAEQDGKKVAVAVVVVPEENISGQGSNEIASPIAKSIMEAVLNS